MMFKHILLGAVLLAASYNYCNAEVVCSEDELIRELQEDLADNCKTFNHI